MSYENPAYRSYRLHRKTAATHITDGDAMDFWRVILADKKSGRLLLYAEMKLPGEAWLEFKFEGNTLYQIATFMPKGVWGRLYWYMLKPAHWFIFKNMLKRIVSSN